MKLRIRWLAAGSVLAVLWGGLAYSQDVKVRDTRSAESQKAKEKEASEQQSKTDVPPDASHTAAQRFGMRPGEPPPKPPKLSHHQSLSPGPTLNGTTHLKDNRTAAASDNSRVEPKSLTSGEGLQQLGEASRIKQEEEMSRRKEAEELSHHRERPGRPRPKSCADAGTPDKVAACREAAKVTRGEPQKPK